MAEAEVDRRIRIRMGRQSLLRHRFPPRCVFFVHEHALRGWAGAAKVINEQLLKLIFFSDRPECLVRVVPVSAGPAGVPRLHDKFGLGEARGHRDPSCGTGEARPDSAGWGTIARLACRTGKLVRLSEDGADGRPGVA
ncbi:Scr1 family TA system antitoxin-like transcriptional regulator [Amycolatopsis nigrescens]|uniref:Scr1 family TA system antitoxin-like transcriptional regulator n=1 Tax=Amycolatopsis nigrescens TaxID=381445 RepID=UPI003CCB9E70